MLPLLTLNEECCLHVLLGLLQAADERGVFVVQLHAASLRLHPSLLLVRPDSMFFHRYAVR